VAASLALAGLAGCGGGPSPAVATVSGVPQGTVRLAQLDRWRGIVSRLARLGDRSAAGPSRAQAEAFLIDALWIGQEAMIRGASVSASELAAQATAQERAVGISGPNALPGYLVAVGITQAEFDYRVRVYALAAKLESPPLAGRLRPPTRPEIASYYARYRKRLVAPERRDLLILVTPRRAAAVAARSRIRAGQRFTAVARGFRFNRGRGTTSGRLSGYTPGELGDPVVDQAIARARVGALVGPVPDRRGYFALFEVVRIVPSHALTVTQAAPTIRASLAAAQRRTLAARFTAQLYATWKPRTSCAAGYVIAVCREARAT
jgi:hypothetical protein